MSAGEFSVDGEWQKNELKLGSPRLAGRFELAVPKATEKYKLKMGHTLFLRQSPKLQKFFQVVSFCSVSS